MQVLASVLTRLARVQAQLDSAHQLGAEVNFRIQGTDLPATVLAVSFLDGKVLYSLGVFTGFLEPEFANSYGLMNSIGWLEDGREYIRVPNIDSIFVESTK